LGGESKIREAAFLSRSKRKINSFKPGMVVQVYNLSYLGGRGWEDIGSRLTLGKKQDSISRNKPGMVVHSCNPTYVGNHRKIEVLSWLRAKAIDPT
jgi:hypothetical protein